MKDASRELLRRWLSFGKHQEQARHLVADTEAELAKPAAIHTCDDTSECAACDAAAQPASADHLPDATKMVPVPDAPDVWNPLNHGIHGVPLMVPAHEYNKLRGLLLAAAPQPPAPADVIDRESAFCEAVVAALKSDSNDLRKEARILRAFREFSEPSVDVAAVREVKADMDGRVGANQLRLRVWADTLARAIGDKTDE